MSQITLCCCNFQTFLAFWSNYFTSYSSITTDKSNCPPPLVVLTPVCSVWAKVSKSCGLYLGKMLAHSEKNPPSIDLKLTTEMSSFIQCGGRGRTTMWAGPGANRKPETHLRKEKEMKLRVITKQNTKLIKIVLCLWKCQMYEISNSLYDLMLNLWTFEYFLDHFKRKDNIIKFPVLFQINCLHGNFKTNDDETKNCSILGF